MHEEGKQTSLSEILQSRRRGKTTSNKDQRNLLHGVLNQGADDDTDSQNSG